MPVWTDWPAVDWASRRSLWKTQTPGITGPGLAGAWAWAAAEPAASEARAKAPIAKSFILNL